MNRRRLGTLGPELSAVGYGAWEIAGRVDREELPGPVAIDAIHAALDAGIDWIDSAETYGAGRSERLVGAACAEWEGDVRVATKLAPIPSSSGSGFEPWQIAWGVRRSLRRLRRGQIDICMLHWPDPHVDLRRTWEALARLADDGLVGSIGLSNFPRELVETCEAIRHVDCLEVEYSLLNRTEEELIAWAGDQGIGVITYGALAYGLLTGARRSAPPQLDWYDWLFAPDRLPANLELADAAGAIARDAGCTAGQLALAWAIHQPGVAVTLAGSTNPAHVRENALAGALALDADAVDRLRALAPAAELGER